MIPTHLFSNPDKFETFSEGSIIFKAGDQGQCVYVVSEGEVDLIVHGITVETVGQGGVFGEMALIEHKPRVATAVAKTNCKLVPIDEKRFNFLIQQTPYFAIHMMKVMADRLRRVDQRL